MAPLRAPVGSASARPGRNGVAEDLPDGRAEALGPLEPAAQGDGAKHAQNVGCRDFLDRPRPNFWVGEAQQPFGFENRLVRLVFAALLRDQLGGDRFNVFADAVACSAFACFLTAMGSPPRARTLLAASRASRASFRPTSG